MFRRWWVFNVSVYVSLVLPTLTTHHDITPTHVIVSDYFCLCDSACACLSVCLRARLSQESTADHQVMCMVVQLEMVLVKLRASHQNCMCFIGRYWVYCWVLCPGFTLIDTGCHFMVYIGAFEYTRLNPTRFANALLAIVNMARCKRIGRIG